MASCAFIVPQALAAASSDGIVVYNAQHENLVKSWVDGFTKETGIKVTLRNGGDSELGNQLVQEGAASPADVFLTENSPAMVLVDNAKLFAPLAAETLQQVAPQYRPEHGRWIGIAARSTVFVYNPAKISEAQLPTSLMDLAAAAVERALGRFAIRRRFSGHRQRDAGAERRAGHPGMA